MRAKELRSRARGSLSGKWGTAVGTTLVASILGVFGNSYVGPVSVPSGGSGVNQAVQELLKQPHGEAALAAIVASVLTALSIFLTIAFIWSVIHFIFGGVLSLGYSGYVLNMVDGKNPQFSNLFDKFGSMFGKGFVMQLLMEIFIFLWSLLLLIPGIVKSFSYAMTPYILVEHPEMSVTEAITLSRKMMDGNKWRLFCLELSFIGWILLSVITFGIATLWVNPYMQISVGEFYRDLAKQNA